MLYDNTDFPVLEKNLIQFFSIESVISVGEVKSTLGKRQFKEALRKLAKNKQLSEEISSIEFGKEKIEEHKYPISFLICKKLNFEKGRIDFEDIYEGIPRNYWHNFILIIEEGLFTYEFEFSNLNEKPKKKFLSNKGNLQATVHFEFPIGTFYKETHKCNPTFIEIKKFEKYEHIKQFLIGLSQAISRKSKFSTDMIYYIQEQKTKVFQ